MVFSGAALEPDFGDSGRRVRRCGDKANVKRESGTGSACAAAEEKFIARKSRTTDDRTDGRTDERALLNKRSVASRSGVKSPSVPCS